ncbi:uncharacterized protein C4orf54-like [Synchiropus splendidus]|uniref:uncharacterized protein C4orf54-like n=1 Tax=Synchiropus splendidus TaxID=270530 RepID=UPI00237ED14C|nr:uncharacterized protein C4orf54-like [Synchiropus splendidus]
MEAAEETLTYRDDTGLHKKLLLLDKDKDPQRQTESKSDESNYVDLDMKPDGPKTVKVSFTGEGNQLSVIKCDAKKHGEDKQPVLVETPSKPRKCDLIEAELDPSDYESDDLQYTDMCLNSKTESNDSASAVLSDHCDSDTLEDESHYITTHEIQLTELDHDVDYDLGQGTCWDFDDNNLVYSFVDYASFEIDDTREVVASGRTQNQGRVEHEESDLCASSDESLCKNLSGDPNVGQIHLSIQTSSQAVNEPVSDNSTCEFTGRHADQSHLSFVNSGARTGPLYGRAPYFIPAPGRQHLATKLRRKDINEYSSGASSSISELDDADKEVRNLTAKSFRSLACPYFDAINLSTSSESSMSEQGLNKWSAYMDWGYRNISHDRDRSVIARKSLEMKRTMQSQKNCPSLNKVPQTTTQNAESTSRQKQQGVTLNLRYDVEAGATDRSKVRYETIEGTQKRATFASSLLKNVISKKMQFEQERKLERGENHDPRECKGRRVWRRRSSDSGSGFNSADDQHLERSTCCEPVGEQNNYKDGSEHQAKEPPKSHLSPSQTSAFDSLRVEPSTDDQDAGNRLTKLLFVPSCPQASKELPHLSTPATGAPPVPQVYNKIFKPGNAGIRGIGGKNPGIKIHLRGVKESKGCTLNIANLLTPKFSNNTINTFRAATNAKCHNFSAIDATPNAPVRDTRDTKCKFATPIYHVRDVRKLVKSSYRFVSLDNSASKCTTLDRSEEKPQTEPVKQRLPSPIVIKCQSVKTNSRSQTSEEAQTRQPERAQVAAKQQPADPSELVADNAEKHEKAGETVRKFEPQIPKQAALEKLKAAVKTMEQLYVYDRNEWKRRSQTPRLSSDRKEQGADEEDADPGSSDKRSLNIICVPYHEKTVDTHLQQSPHQNRAGSKPDKAAPPMRDPESPVAPLCVKIEAPKCNKTQQQKVKPKPSTPAVALDSENYLTIPGLSSQAALLSAETVSKVTNTGQQQTGDSKISEQRLMTQSPASVIHHQPAAASQTHQVLCFSPSVNTLSPTPSAGEAAPQTQRKMLLDPTTGHYYLVDTPLQSTTKRLFDPETGQYVDVPMSTSPVSPITPVPLSVSPLALGPGAYMICPGFIPSPTLTAQVLSPQPQAHLVDVAGGKVKHTKSSKQELNTGGAESAYYSATGEAFQGSLQLPVSVGSAASREDAGGSDRKPVISITSQQGPRIIAPPSFDGTTMSFVVEHR